MTERINIFGQVKESMDRINHLRMIQELCVPRRHVISGAGRLAALIDHLATMTASQDQHENLVAVNLADDPVVPARTRHSRAPPISTAALKGLKFNRPQVDCFPYPTARRRVELL